MKISDPFEADFFIRNPSVSHLFVPVFHLFFALSLSLPSKTIQEFEREKNAHGRRHAIALPPLLIV